MFIHVEHEIPKLERVTLGDKRLYKTPSGVSYPSVTTVTGLLNKTSIQEWRERVGSEEADRISSRAAKRGTKIHSLCEDYLSNRVPKVSPFDYEMFESVKPELNKINNIHCLETPLFSHKLQVAGTVDCIAEYEGRLSVIDFKTSSREKDRDHIHNYFMQCAAYCHMFMELTAVPCSQIVVIMGCDDRKNALVFREKYVDWIDGFRELRSDYAKLYNI